MYISEFSESKAYSPSMEQPYVDGPFEVPKIWFGSF